MKRILIAAFALMMTAGIASADRGPGRPGGPGGPGGPDGGPGGNAIVAADDTIIVKRVVTDSATDTSSVQLIAVTSSGATAWTATLTGPRDGRLVLSGDNLLSLSFTAATDAATGSSAISARSIATGAISWTVTLSGRVTDLEPFSGGTYAIVATPATAAGGNPTRSLVAISHSGATLFTVAL